MFIILLEQRKTDNWPFGVPGTVAQALIGDDSAKVHSDYISIGREALRTAVNLFPAL